MSRRVQLCLCVLLMGLVGIPLAYVIVNWKPQEPLRFRVVSGSSEGSAAISSSTQEHAQHYELELEMVNASSIPIQVYNGTVWTAPVTATRTTSQGFFGAFDLMTATNIDVFVSRAFVSSHARGSGKPALPGGALIPAHGTVRVRIQMLQGSAPMTGSEPLCIRYMWNSQPRHLADRALIWMRQRAPLKLSGHLTRLVPNENTTSITLPGQVEKPPAVASRQ